MSDELAMSDDAPVRVLLIGKPDCHLCDEARSVIEHVCKDLNIGWEEKSILDDPMLADEYWDTIPVTLVDGKAHDIYRVSESRLRNALES